MGMTLQEQFGELDVYLFDQMLRGNILPGMRVLDAGCGGGRNVKYLLREGYEVFGVDVSAEAVAELRNLASKLAPRLPAENFQVAPVEAMPFADEFADLVICHSVLHFAQDEAQLQAMVRGLWRVLRPGGMLFCRLASTIGAGEGMAFEPLGGRRFRMVHGADWLLVDEALLMELTRSLDGDLVDPLKTTVVQGQRCMTTWVLKKKAPPQGESRAFVSSGMPARRPELDRNNRENQACRRPPFRNQRVTSE
jgi:SAM-dependent methyltransferase